MDCCRAVSAGVAVTWAEHVAGGPTVRNRNCGSRNLCGDREICDAVQGQRTGTCVSRIVYGLIIVRRKADCYGTCAAGHIHIRVDRRQDKGTSFRYTRDKPIALIGNGDDDTAWFSCVCSRCDFSHLYFKDRTIFGGRDGVFVLVIFIAVLSGIGLIRLDSRFGQRIWRCRNSRLKGQRPA